MLSIKNHFKNQEIDFTDEVKFKLSLEIIDNFKKMKLTNELLQNELKDLYNIVKIIKKKVN